MPEDFSRRVSANASDVNGDLIPDATIEWYVNDAFAGSGDGAGHSSIEVLDSSATIAVKAKVGDLVQGPVKLGPQQAEYNFHFDREVHPRWRSFVMKHFPALVGIVFILLALALVFTFQKPTPLQVHVLLALFALGGGGFGGEIAGFINADLTLSAKLKISAGGAAAIFVLLYFFVPAGSG
jgi:hypothetical protein